MFVLQFPCSPRLCSPHITTHAPSFYHTAARVLRTLNSVFRIFSSRRVSQCSERSTMYSESSWNAGVLCKARRVSSVNLASTCRPSRCRAARFRRPQSLCRVCLMSGSPQWYTRFRKVRPHRPPASSTRNEKLASLLAAESDRRGPALELLRRQVLQRDFLDRVLHDARSGERGKHPPPPEAKATGKWALSLSSLWPLFENWM